MKRIAILNIIIVLMFGSVLARAVDPEKPGAGEIVIIVNHKSTLSTTLTKHKIKEIFLGNERFEGAIKLYPMGQKDDKLLKIILDKYIGMTLSEYKDYWVGKTYADGISAPKLIEDSHEIVKNVWMYPGGIGYMWAVDLNEKEKELVIVVTPNK